MATLVELTNIHGHRVYVNTDHIRRLEPRGENPPTTLVVYSSGTSETIFEMVGYIDEIADWLNEEMAK